MKYLYALCFTLLLVNVSRAQTCEDFAVELSATVQASPASITLHWHPLADTTTYNIYRKSKTSLIWGSPIAMLTTVDSTYTDNSVIADSAYEYQVLGGHHSGSLNWEAAGYIYAAVQSPAIHTRGALILMVDSAFTDSCAAGIHRLMKDVSGDGWQLVRHDVARTLPDTAVKALIKNDYATIPNVKAVMILGHVAVPYSGDLNPDGHPDHLGAWPADIYYADMTGTWTDDSVNDVSAGYAANINIPGDGKWDQTIIPNLTQLQVARVDFYDMPGFAASEVQLMRSYLNKDHMYKMDSLVVRHRGIISDNFGVFSVPDAGITYYEAFASSAWRSFAPLLSRDSVAATSAVIPNLDTASYQWSYGCGGGWFSGAGGIGATSDFATHQVNGIFTMLFGSYFGDWNVADNFLRAPLCSSNPGLTCCWSGRPYWFFHHMALGENIGFSAWCSQNNDGNLYAPGNIYGIQQWVHVALMGDLTLRTEYVQPVTNLTVASVPLHGAILNWIASADTAVHGYYVYKSATEFGSYRLVSGLLSATTYHDTVGADGLQYYMVRPVKVQSTPSGVYNNLGIGSTDTATVSYPPLSIMQVTEPVYTEVYPNPASDVLNIAVTTSAPVRVTCNILNVTGVHMMSASKQLLQGRNTITFNVNSLPSGVYVLEITMGGSTDVRKWVKL